MRFSVASYSFHRLLAAGQQDMFKYIEDCKALGAAQLDPWNGHLEPLNEETKALKSGADWANETFSDAGLAYVARVKAAADAAGLPFGCLAVDGAHIWEATPEARQINRAAAYRWIDVAQRLGAKQIRIDSGGTPDMPDEMFGIIVEGFKDVVAYAKVRGIEVIMENHWGANNVPANIVKILDAVAGLGLLFDSNNWYEGTQQEGWERCAKYARSVHIKTFKFDEQGNDPTVDIPKCIAMLIAAGYHDVWGIESVPVDGDEMGAVKKTVALIQHSLQLANA
jgi:sugar phosphate isomerase/epimerase